MKANQVLDFSQLSDVILGAHFYACGGGGALENGMALLDEVAKLFGGKDKVQLPVIDIEDVADNAQLPVLAAMGAPQEFLAKGYSHSPVSAFQALESLLQTHFASVSPVETGPIAYGMSMLCAAANNIPMVNGDGGGRAFPCLQLSTFANPELAQPITVSPGVLTSEKKVSQGGGVITIECQSSVDVDAITRGIISTSQSFDQRASLASFAMTGAQLKQPNAFVPNMVTACHQLGRSIREAVSDKLDCFPVISGLPHEHCVMKGKLVDIESTTSNGFEWVTLKYQSHHNGKTYHVVAQNENMLLWVDDKTSPIAMAPDLICCISADATLMSNDEILSVWQQDPQDPRFNEMAIFTLSAAEPIQQPWFHQNFASIFQKFGYFGDYRAPLQAE